MQRHTKSVGPRSKKLALALPAAILFFLAARIFISSEPNYRGQPLSYWIEEHRRLNVFGELILPSHIAREPDDSQQPGLREARAAIRAIGTPALPYLLQWMRYEPPKLGSRFLPWAPVSLRFKVDRTFFSQERANRAEAAMQALAVLGTNAAPAIPALAALATKTKTSNNYKARRAAVTMSKLGPEALPAMLNLWSNCIPADKAFLTAVIDSQLFPDIRSWPYISIFPDNHTKDQLPILFYVMQVQGEPYRSAASNAIWWLAPGLLTNTPAK
jgi:hypothetical protein